MRPLTSYRVRPAWRSYTPWLVIALTVVATLGLLRGWAEAQRVRSALSALLAFEGLCQLAALGGMLLVRRSVHLAALEAHKDAAGYVYTTLGAAYAVLLSFMVVTSWTRYRDADETVTKEAITVATLFHLADGFEEPTRRLVQGTLLVYTQAVLDHEWARMEHQGESEPAWTLSDRLWRLYMDIPAAEQARPAYAPSLTQIQEFYALRARRLLQSRTSLPAVVWIVLIVGAIITVGFAYLFGVRSLSAQVVMTVALTTVIAGSLFLILDLDNPFGGTLRVDPTPFETNRVFFTSQLQR